MITIEYYSKDYPPMVSWLVCEAMLGETTEYQGLYWSGLSEPNYPMPAIRLQVEIQPDRVILWRKSRPYWEFQYLASTIPTKLWGRWAE